MAIFAWFTTTNPTAQLTRIEQKVDTLMTQVQVAQEDLDQLDTDLDTATAAIVEHIDALEAAHPELPAGDLSALRADADALRAISTPTVEPLPEEPPTE